MEYGTDIVKFRFTNFMNILKYPQYRKTYSQKILLLYLKMF